MPDEPKPAEPPAATPSAPPAEAAAPTTEARPAEDWESRFKYLLADFENFRKRSERERQAQRLILRAELLRTLLPLHEAFSQARRTIDPHLSAGDPVRQGIELLGREWDALMRAEGVEPIARVGEPFRADLHEAVGEHAPNAEVAEGRVFEVVQQGYRTREVLLRPAKVIVARQPAAGQAPEGTA